MARSLWTGTIGVLLTALGIYWLLNPPQFFGNLCVTQPCAINTIAAALTSAVGVFLILLAFAQYRAAKKPQTVTVAIDEEAEKDAAAVSEISTAVQKGESAEPKLAEPTAHDKAVEEVFATMPREEIKEGAAVDTPKPVARASAKKKAAKKKVAKKAPAKKKAAKKKK